MSVLRHSLIAAGLALLASVALALASRPKAPDRPPRSTAAAALDHSTTDGRIARQQEAVREQPQEAGGYVALAAEYLQKARETGDASVYGQAEAAIDRALGLDRRDPGALVVRGLLRLARHDFRGALADGRSARSLAPDLVRPLGVVVDASVELGRYRKAERVLQRMVTLKPDLSSYARVSYVRELRGDLTGALSAMRLAVSAAGTGSENAAYVRTLLGNLQFTRGRYVAADRAFADALTAFPDYPAALAGRARVRAARGQLGAAIRDLRSVVTRLPLTEHIVALGEAELAAGRVDAARRDLELVRVQQQLQRSARVNVDVELALFEADHGDSKRAVSLARRAWAAAPSVRSADAMVWALKRSGHERAALRWIPRALRLGTRDPTVLYHAGMAAQAAGRQAQARHLLRRALSTSPRFSAYRAPRARRALERLCAGCTSSPRHGADRRLLAGARHDAVRGRPRGHLVGERPQPASRGRRTQALARAVPIVSALLIVGVGVVPHGAGRTPTCSDAKTPTGEFLNPNGG